MANQQIIDWIRQQERGGYSQQQIYASLMQNGYSDEQARQALFSANQSQQSMQQPQQSQQQQQPRQSQHQSQQPGPVQQVSQQGQASFQTENIISMSIFSLISLGIYVSIWFDRIIKSQDQNDPSLKTTKELNSLIKYLGVFLIIVTVGFIAVSNMNLTSFLENLDLSSDIIVAIQMGLLTQVYIFTLVFFLLGIYAISIAVAMRSKRFIESAYSGTVSGIGLAFGALFLQKRINDFNSGKK